MTESEVLAKIMIKLKFNSDIVWHMRINAGKFGSHMMAPAGTPDIVAVVKKGNGNIGLLFLEVKKTGVTRLRYEQEKFFNSMVDKPMTLCRVINDPDKLIDFIREIRRL